VTMAPLWTSDDIAKATGGIASAPFEVHGVTFDSREVEAGHLFIALKGEVTDGHRFIDKATDMGASGQLLSQSADVPHILVKDTTDALNALGLASRQRTAAKIIGVTGSVGKTGTKEALAAALQRGNRGGVHRSVKSYNNHTGVPLSLARMPASTSFGVFEMGMNHAGELAQLTQLVRPHVALVTWIASAHREFFETEEAIADAKGEIFQGLEPGGTAIIPFDSIHRDRLIAAAKPYAANIVTFGRGEGADVRAMDVTQTQQGTRITAKLPDTELHFTLAPPGDHWVNNALGILAAVQAVGGDLAAAGLALAELEGLAGRGAQHKVNLQTGGTALVIDESYNANPASMRATLSVLAHADATRKIVVLGEMRELGHESDAMHAALADPIVEAGAEIALLVGEGMGPLAKALEGRINVRHCATADAALDALNGHITNGDALLIKGSNAVGLSRVVAALVSGVSGR
jgi:UDP-N-acetylmuramoyl-tripeptide--D-alanyl-D-alanine ligase